MPAIFAPPLAFISFITWLIISSIAIGKAGIANFMQLLHERDVLQENNTRLSIQTQILEDQIYLLRHSPDYQSHYLKQHFGYVEQNESIYQFKKK